jgi:Flp pilus assembly protein TadG
VIATVVDWAALRDVVLYSLGAGIGITIAFSLAIFGGTRFADMRRAERGAEAVGFAALAVVGLGVCAAAIVLGIVLITSK